jgi:hypothetical protein
MMIDMLPVFMRKSLVYKAVFDAEASQFQISDVSISDTNLQLSVDTATWALAIYEKELGILTDISKPLSDRRSVIKSKMRGSGKIDAVLLKIVADSYTNGGVEVSFNGAITITFVAVHGIPPNLDDLKAAIEEIKPAHLRLQYIFTYITFGQLEGKTFGQIEAAGLTFGQLEKTLP